MHFSVITLFPEIFESPLAHSILGRARQNKLVSIDLMDLRHYARGRHRITDDYPYGGGQGMVLKPEPLIDAIEDSRRRLKNPRVILLSPHGRVFNQEIAAETLRHKEVVLVCGRYEGVDERVLGFTDETLSIGDYTLSGGEIPALTVIDTVTRLIPGVLGNKQSPQEESFVDGLLEYPQYTRPAQYRNMNVPEVLLSGNHEEIRQWRHRMSIEATARLRPDLLAKVPGGIKPSGKVYVALLHYPVSARHGDTVTSSITNLDIHDIARTCRTYGVSGFYVVNPVKALQKLAARIIDHWERGYGSSYNSTRRDALALVRLSDTLDEAIADAQQECGAAPRLVATSARPAGGTGRTTFANMREMLIREDTPCMILLGTGWGLADSVFARSDLTLEPIAGTGDYNHLSVRAASAIMLDRILGHLMEGNVK